jgi:osmotically-inducible protein OsmY
MNKTVTPWLSIVALSVVLVGCDKGGKEATVGQRVDQTVAKTESKAADAKAAAQSSVESAKQSAEAAGAKAADAVADARITSEVKAALAADAQLSALRIDVDTVNGVVTLKGPAPDEKARSRATQIAASPKGVTRVDNQLTIKGS